MSDETQTSEESPSAGKFKLLASNNQGEKVDRIVLEGTSTFPKRALVVGGEAQELTEAQVKQFKSEGIKLRKDGDAEDNEGGDAEGEDSSQEPKKAEQQAEQAATTGTAPRSSAPAGTTKGADSKSSAPKTT